MRKAGAAPGRRQGRGGHGAAGVWRRQNPEAAYVESLAGGAVRGLIRDNKANAAIPVGEMKRFAHTMDPGIPKPLYQLAAVIKLADRVHFANSIPRLGKLLARR